jgi:hypothetical protein
VELGNQQPRPKFIAFLNTSLKRLGGLDKFNHWTITGFDRITKRYTTICVCGKEGKVSSSSLKSGKSKSCGCKQKDFLVDGIIESNYRGLRWKIWDNYRRAAKKRGYDFELDLDEFTHIIEQDCHYCGIEPEMTYNYSRPYGNSAVEYSDYRFNGVDRVDNNEGYKTFNCVPCCKICNNSKSTLSSQEWLDWIKRVHGKQFG